MEEAVKHRIDMLEHSNRNAYNEITRIEARIENLERNTALSLILPDQQEEAKDNVVPLKVITGGKSPTGNWLWDLPNGTEFLVQQKVPAGQPHILKPFLLGQWEILYKSEKGVRLSSDADGPQQVFAWVDPVTFVRQFDLFEILHKGEEIE